MVLGVVVVGLLAILVVRQLSSDTVSRQSASNPASGSMKEQEATKQNPPVPETVDDVTQSIVSESQGDAAALDEEEAGTLDEVNADSDSVNNLGTSYDENSF